MEGYVNSPAAVEALEFYKALYECCTPPGHSDAYMVANLDAYKSGQVAMQMNWFAFFPGIAQGRRRGRRQVRLLRQPAAEHRGLDPRRPGHLGGGLLRQAGCMALEYIKWFAKPRGAEEVVVAGRLLLPQVRCWTIRTSPAPQPFAADFLKAMSGVKDFWQEPTYAELLLSMQKRVHDYVVADQGTAQEALDKLIEDWTRSSRTTASSRSPPRPTAGSHAAPPPPGPAG